MLPGAHAWVQGFAHDGSEDPCRASDEPLPSKVASRKWSSSAQNRTLVSSIRRGNAVDGLISDPDSELHAAFKAGSKSTSSRSSLGSSASKCLLRHLRFSKDTHPCSTASARRRRRVTKVAVALWYPLRSRPAVRGDS